MVVRREWVELTNGTAEMETKTHIRSKAIRVAERNMATFEKRGVPVHLIYETSWTLARPHPYWEVQCVEKIRSRSNTPLVVPKKVPTILWVKKVPKKLVEALSSDMDRNPRLTNIPLKCSLDCPRAKV